MGEWRWTQNQTTVISYRRIPVTYTNWDPPGESSNNAGNEDCMTLVAYHDGLWNDFPCYYMHQYIREMKIKGSFTLT